MTEFEFGEKAYVVSPHQDDAVISIGNHLMRYGEVTVVNVFTESASHILPGLSEEVDHVSAMRNAEDAATARAYGFNLINGGFQDSEVRGVAWNDYWAADDTELQTEVNEFILNSLSDTDEKTDVFLPAAFGLHPDHILAHQAGLQAMKMVGVRVSYLYAEQPYYETRMPVRLTTHDMLNREKRITLPFDEHKKRIMLERYPSQLSDSRIDWLAKRGAEYVWPLDDLMNGRAERYQNSPPIFSGPVWEGVAGAMREEEGKEIMKLQSHDEAGEGVGALVFIDEQHVDGSPVRFMRAAGAGYYDYFDFHGEGICDGESLGRLMDQARMHADAVWLSGIREDSPTLPILEDHAKQTRGAVLLEGAPSFIADCHPDGFTAWADAMPRSTRKKIRRNDRKLEALASECNGRIYTAEADHAILQSFLDLQAQRAATSDGRLDAFAEDRSYVSLLKSLSERKMLHACVAETDSGVIGVMLFSYDDSGDVLHIINQGFDPDYAEYGVGFILQQGIIRQAHQQGARSVDYLKGDEPYKRWFTNRTLKVYKYCELLSEDGRQNEEVINAHVMSYVE